MSDNLDEELMDAVLTNSFTEIPILLDRGADPCRICSSGRTALGTAAQQGDVILIEILLDWCKIPNERKATYRRNLKSKKHHPNVNQGYYIMVHDNNDNSANVTPEGMEAMAWDEELQNNSLGEAASNKTEDEWASLYRWYACILERTATLIETGGPEYKPDSLDAFRKSPMHYAAEQGHSDVIKLLVRAGINVDPIEVDVNTPLHIATSNNHTKAMLTLLEAGALPNKKSIDKNTALHIAASRGFKNACEILLRFGASVDALDSSDRTPLLLAVNRGHENVVEILINRGARVNAEEIHGYTPLCEAVWQQNANIVSKLLSNGARVTQSHRLLHYCAHNRCVSIAKMLLQHGSVSNLRDDTGDTPLLIAARTAQLDFVELLLQNGASATCRHGITGSTALHEAVEGCCTAVEVFHRILCTLRNYGANLNAQTLCGGETALYRALLSDYDDIAEVLIKEGADVEVCDLQMCIVDNLTLAQKRGNLRIVKLLVYSGFTLRTLRPSTTQKIEYPQAWEHSENPSDWLLFTSTRPFLWLHCAELKYDKC
ncbi:ankyrin-1-like [Ctenocephalides felis]|uniref:ankyrin-1-like n=1 Tax=Ctenocephalides felis TaxID=7515 RepID=UPI000E6E5089|nr:ankyrin-1-like [Ctenocephalides felis]